MRYIFGVLIVVLSTYIGHLLANKYRERKLFYDSLLNFNDLLINQVSFGQKSILELIKNDKNDCLYIVLREYFYANNFNETYLNFLDNTEIDFIKNYFKLIGVGEKNSQIEYLKSIKIEIMNKLNNATENVSKYTKLYLKLGFLIGLLIFVSFL